MTTFLSRHPDSRHAARASLYVAKAHLGLGELAQLARLVDVVAQRFLAVDRKSRVQGTNGSGEVMVVRRGI